MRCLRLKECTEVNQGGLREAVQAAGMASAKALRPQSSVLSRGQNGQRE